MHLPSGVDPVVVITCVAVPCAAALVWWTRGGVPDALARRALTLGAVLALTAPVLAVATLLAGRYGVRIAAADRMSLATSVAAVVSAAAAALFVGLLRLPGVAGGYAVMVRHFCDGLAVAAAIWFVGWVLVVPPTMVLGEHTPAGCVPLLLPASAAAMAAGLAFVSALRTAGARAGVLLAGLGASTVALAGVGLAGGVCRHWPGAVTAAALVLPAGLAAVAAGVWRLHARAPVKVDMIRTATAYAFLPMLAISAAAVYHWARGGQWHQLGLMAGLVEGFALVSRQYLALRDVRRYAGELSVREAHFRELAHTDALTGLANRRGLLRTMYRDAVGGPPCVLVGIDLDGFKNINDMRGHDVGDAVLIEVGRRLVATIPPGDVAARLGGDEFAVLMWSDPARAPQIAHRLLDVLCEPFASPRGTLYLSASIGLAGCASANDVPTLLRNADLALRYAKQRGKCRVERYDVAYDQLVRRRSTLEQELREAVRRGQLHLAYQPVVALPSARPVGAEALLRWDHPSLGAVPPDEFIPVAEDTGMINQIGAWVLRQACRRLSTWLADGHDVWLSVNVSPRELHAPDYVSQVARVLAEYGIPPQRLVLEVTEHVVATDLAEMARRLRALRATGVRVALDDFGAGYSSLGQLRHLPVDILKIDQSLVAGSELSGADGTGPLVDVVVGLGHRLGLQVIAEGMQEPAQRDVVAATGCRYGQCRLFGHAVPAEHFEAQLAAARRLPARITAVAPASAIAPASW